MEGNLDRDRQPKPESPTTPAALKCIFVGEAERFTELAEAAVSTGFAPCTVSLWDDLGDLGSASVAVLEWTDVAEKGAGWCRRLRKQSGVRLVAALIESGGQDTLDEAYAQGVDVVLTHPLSPGDFRARLVIAKRLIVAETEAREWATKYRTAQESMSYASRRFEELFQSLPVACFSVGSDGLIYEWNREAESAFDIPVESAFMHLLDDVLGSVSDEFWSASLVRELVHYGDAQCFQWALLRQGQCPRTFVSHVYPSTGPDGSVNGILCANLDITDRVEARRQVDEHLRTLEQMNARLAHLSSTDGLTGLLNHRMCMTRLSEAIKGIGNEHTSAALLLLDVDRFKQYNDTYGHLAGDAVLREVGSILTAVCPKGIQPARYGGEEFAIVLPGFSADQALAVAEAIRLAIQSHPWTERPVTASLGVGLATSADATPNDLIAQADRGLYRSKELGRNQVQFLVEA